jgi:2-aminoethylphosphonate-pyruvate transaminase
MMEQPPPPARDKLLFTPGPLTTSLSVKAAMLRDAGSWHFEFNEIVRGVREKLLEVAGVPAGEYVCVLMQGSGTFGVEATVTSTVPPDGRLLVAVNGAYGERIVRMAEVARVPVTALRFPEDQPADPEAIALVLADDPSITSVAAVHCETTTGVLNPIEAIGEVVSRARRTYIVDAMSSFGAVPIDMRATGIDYLVSSANKCIEGVPGFSFVIARREALLATDGFARSLSLDLLGQLRGFEANGQFRFTPPTHVVLAFAQALKELDAEGGVGGRAARYRANHETLVAGMRGLGFRALVRPEEQSYIITSFLYPEHPRFEFAGFYRRLSDKGMIIYPGKLTQVDSFRIGNIGRLFEADIRALLAAIRETLIEMGIREG